MMEKNWMMMMHQTDKEHEEYCIGGSTVFSYPDANTVVSFKRDVDNQRFAVVAKQCRIGNPPQSSSEPCLSLYRCFT